MVFSFLLFFASSAYFAVYNFFELLKIILEKKMKNGLKTNHVRTIILLSILHCLLSSCNSTVLEGGGSGSTDDNPLVAPRAIQITALDSTLMVNWTRIAAAQGHDPSYEVWYAPTPHVENATMWCLAPPPSYGNLVSVYIPGLTNDVPYYVWVKADYGTLGKSNFCPMSVGIPVPPPEKPTLTVTGGEGLLEVSWTADPHAYFYELGYVEGSNGNPSPPTSAEQWTIADPPITINGQQKGGYIITGLQVRTYTVWVRAANTAGESEYRRTSGTPVMVEASAPSAPDQPTVTPGNKKLTVSWNAQARASSYKLYCGTGSNFTSATPYLEAITPSFGVVSAEVILPANSERYYVWVVACNSQGDSAPSPSASGTPEAPVPINFSDVNFVIGSAQAEYIFSETNPPGPFPTSDALWDRLTRRKETALGNLFCDASAWYVRTKYDETFDFMFLNGGYLDQPLNKGAITVGAIESIPPPDAREDFYTIITLRGPELQLLFNQAAAVRNMGRGGRNTGGWGMVSAETRYTIVYPTPPSGATEAELELSYYGEIKPNSVTINGVSPDFSESATYRVCTANYLAAGGDGYTPFVIAMRDYPGVANVRNIRVPIWQGVCEYIYDKGKVIPLLDGRVKQEGGGVMCE
jgi:hypothetical protein